MHKCIENTKEETVQYTEEIERYFAQFILWVKIKIKLLKCQKVLWKIGKYGK